MYLGDTHLLPCGPMNTSSGWVRRPPKFSNCARGFFTDVQRKEKLDITYVGSAKDTTLINVSFPALETQLEDHELTLVWSQYFTNTNSFHLEPLISSGIPSRSSFCPWCGCRQLALFPLFDRLALISQRPSMISLNLCIGLMPLHKS